MCFKKRKSLLIITVIIIFSFVLCIFNNSRNEARKDITAAADQYVTSGFFNSNRMLKIDSYKITFSDSNNAILEVTGMEYNAPHKTIVLKLTMSKDKQGFWSVIKSSNYDDTNTSNEFD